MGGQCGLYARWVKNRIRQFSSESLSGGRFNETRPNTPSHICWVFGLK